MVEYNNLMRYLTLENTNLLNLVLMPNLVYQEEKQKIGLASTKYIFSLLEQCRIIVSGRTSGYKIIRYLLYTMKNINIKKQLNKGSPLTYMSNLSLKSKCFPFEKLPFVMSMADHTPTGEDLFMSLENENCEYELLARHILNNIEQNGILYTPLNDVLGYGNIEELIKIFNSKLYGADQLNLKLIK